MIAASLGRRASNSSATRGRPPVMSRVLALSVEMRASTSPALTVAPGSTAQIGRAGRAAPVDDHALGDAGRLVHGFDHRLAVDQVLVGGHAVDLSEDRT